MYVKLTFTDEMLGTKASDSEVFARFIASKCPDDDKRKLELELAENREEAGTTVFHRQDEKPGIWAYQIKGFFKDAAEATNRFDADQRNGLEKLSAFKKKIDQCLFVLPDWIPLQLPSGAGCGFCERPLRAETAQGPRVTVVRSESVPVGTTVEFEIKILSKDLAPYVEFWLGYGALRGLGQWRNSGKGRFATQFLKEPAKA